jgi:Smg protein
MKENVLDVLIYLFDNYLDGSSEYEPDRENLTIELEQAGFHDAEIEKAFEWLDALAAQRDKAVLLPQVSGVQVMRIYAPEEISRLDADSRGFLLYLEQNGILSPLHREIVIDRVMALDSEEIDIEQVKWVVLMVLFNMPGQEATYAWMEDLVFEDSSESAH